MRFPPNETPMMPMSGKKRTKRIVDHTAKELDAAVQAAVDKFGEDFWLLLHGVDAYMERRRRQVGERNARIMQQIADEVLTDPWGNS